MLIILFSILLVAVLIGASPSIYVSYALDDQLPPIARINSPFTWSFSPDTFVSDPPQATLNYTASSIPVWLSFDPSTRTLSGTPSEEDEGSPEIIITATDLATGQAVSSPVTLCVTRYPPPQLYIPVERQFIPDNPSLSSVFLVSNTSALYNSRPALRIPPKWSFSIGFQPDTFLGPNDVYYAARTADGAPLPDWVDFNAHDLTFDGVTPPVGKLSLPHTLQVALHASDQHGYTAGSILFDVVVASHDFALLPPTNTLPTINVTTEQPFRLSLSSAADFSGVTLDGQPVEPANITSLEIDTSGLESWLNYDESSRTLTGSPPDEFSAGVLPVVLQSNVNQTLHTKVTLAAVPSFFSVAEMDPVLVTPGNNFSFNLGWHFSNVSGLGKSADIELSAAYSPLEAGYFLTFDSGSHMLSGTVPENVTFNHVAVTFTAYSGITHSTSHTSLPLSLSSSDFDKENKMNGGSGLSDAARAKLLLGLKIAFGIICGFVNLAIIFALIRRCTRVPDSAVVGEEGRRAWTADELKWYGIGIEVNGEKYEPPSVMSGNGYGTSEAALAGSGLVQSFSRLLARTFSNTHGSPLSPVGLAQSPGVIRKVEFFGKVRQTARIVSDKYRRAVSGPRRPMISKPTLILTGEDANRIPPVHGDIEGLPGTNVEGLLPMIIHPSQSELQPFEDASLIRYAPSGLDSPSDSPSSSTDGRSIPRRRADFAPPKAVAARAQVHLGNEVQVGNDDHRSVDSFASSLATNSSTRTHEAEAVIQRATRAMSVRSATSGFSNATGAADGGLAVMEVARPRLVPFTSATRVPVPKLPSSSLFSGGTEAQNASASQAESVQRGTRRVASQMAKVFRNAGAAEAERSSGTGGAPSRAKRKKEGGGVPPVPRMLARTGERFRFKVPVAAWSLSGGEKEAKGRLEARLVSGKPLPRFIKVDVDAVGVSGAGAQGPGEEQKRVVELSGVPVSPNIGVYEIGVYEQDGGACVGKVVVEIVPKKAT